MTVTVRPAPRVARHDIDWTPIEGAVVWMPPEHRLPTVDDATAMRMLRCTPASFDALRRLGLAATDTPTGQRYDTNDVRNAGLYSRSGRTEVETALGAVLSFLRGGDDDLFAERAWTYAMTPSPGAGADVLVHPPAPEAHGGETRSCDVDGEPVPWVGARARVPAGSVLRGAIVTRGRRETVRSGALLDVVERFVASGVRWHYLSPGMKQDAHAAFALGVGNCDTMSLVLAGQLADAGFEPRVLRGWIVGITEVPHSWIEVTDIDGRVKVVDPSLIVLAERSSLGSPGFAGKALGSTLSRIVPTRCPLAEPIGMTTDGAPRDVRFACRPAATTAASAGGAG